MKFTDQPTSLHSETRYAGNMTEGAASFTITRPPETARGLPLVFASPHSGDRYPADMNAAPGLTQHSLRSAEDALVAYGQCGENTAAMHGAVGDFDNDGRFDLLVADANFSSLFRNLGGLKFQDANRSAGLPDDLFGLGLAVADVNEDGRPDRHPDVVIAEARIGANIGSNCNALGRRIETEPAKLVGEDLRFGPTTRSRLRMRES